MSCAIADIGEKAQAKAAVTTNLFMKTSDFIYDRLVAQRFLLLISTTYVLLVFASIGQIVLNWQSFSLCVAAVTGCTRGGRKGATRSRAPVVLAVCGENYGRK
jgi:hypothetical protein